MTTTVLASPFSGREFGKGSAGRFIWAQRPWRVPGWRVPFPAAPLLLSSVQAVLRSSLSWWSPVVQSLCMQLTARRSQGNDQPRVTCARGITVPVLSWQSRGGATQAWGLEWRRGLWLLTKGGQGRCDRSEMLSCCLCEVQPAAGDICIRHILRSVGGRSPWLHVPHLHFAGVISRRRLCCRHSAVYVAFTCQI